LQIVFDNGLYEELGRQIQPTDSFLQSVPAGV